MNYDETNFSDQELESLSELKYQAQPITFEPKSALYKKRPVAAYFGIAASLLLLLSFGLLSYNANNQDAAVQTTLASKQTVTNLKQQPTKKLKTVVQNVIANPSQLNKLETTKFHELKLTPQSDKQLLISFEKENNTSSASAQSTFSSNRQEQTIKQLKPLRILHYCAPLIETFQFAEAQNNDIKLDLNINLLAKLDRLVSKDIGLSNNQSYDLLLPGKSNIDAQITSVGTLSQTRFQSVSSLRSHTQTEQMQMQQQFSIDAYARALRSGFGLQTNYKQFANGAISDYEVACIAAPKVLLSRNIIIEPSLRLKL